MLKWFLLLPLGIYLSHPYWLGGLAAQRLDELNAQWQAQAPAAQLQTQQRGWLQSHYQGTLPGAVRIDAQLQHGFWPLSAPRLNGELNGELVRQWTATVFASTAPWRIYGEQARFATQATLHAALPRAAAQARVTLDWRSGLMRAEFSAPQWRLPQLSEPLQGEQSRLDWQHRGLDAPRWQSEGTLHSARLRFQPRHSPPLEAEELRLSLRLEQQRNALLSGELELHCARLRWQQKAYPDAVLRLRFERLERYSLQGLLRILARPDGAQKTFMLGLWLVQQGPLLMKHQPALFVDELSLQGEAPGLRATGHLQSRAASEANALPALLNSLDGQLQLQVPRELLVTVLELMARRAHHDATLEASQLRQIQQQWLNEHLDKRHPPDADGTYRLCLRLQRGQSDWQAGACQVGANEVSKE